MKSVPRVSGVSVFDLIDAFRSQVDRRGVRRSTMASSSADGNETGVRCFVCKAFWPEDVIAAHFGKCFNEFVKLRTESVLPQILKRNHSLVTPEEDPTNRDDIVLYGKELPEIDIGSSMLIATFLVGSDLAKLSCASKSWKILANYGFCSRRNELRKQVDGYIPDCVKHCSCFDPHDQTYMSRGNAVLQLERALNLRSIQIILTSLTGGQVNFTASTLDSNSVFGILCMLTVGDLMHVSDHTFGLPLNQTCLQTSTGELKHADAPLIAYFTTLPSESSNVLKIDIILTTRRKWCKTASKRRWEDEFLPTRRIHADSRCDDETWVLNSPDFTCTFSIERKT